MSLNCLLIPIMKKVEERMGNEKDFKFGDLKKFLKSKPEEKIQKKKEIIEKQPIVEQYDEFIGKLEVEKVEKVEKKPATITCGICDEKVPSNFFDDHFAKCKAEEGEAERIGIDIEKGIKVAKEEGMQYEVIQIIERIERIERNWDLDIMQKLITVKNVLNYSQSTWSLGVCNEILGEGSLRGSTKKVGSGLIKTIKKICKLR